MTTLIPKFDFKDGNLTPTGAVNRTINEKLSEIVSITDFGGASGNGDNTTAMNNATAYLNSLGGGTVLIPSGDWKMNWICTYSGITVQGSGGKGELDTNCIRPYDITKPAITISDGTSIARYVSLINVHISGTDGTTNGLTKAANNAPQALLLNGGTVNFTADRCVFYNGLQTIAFTPSATQPVVTNRIVNSTIRNDITDSSSARAIYQIRLAGAGYLTDNIFIGTKLNGPSNGYAAEIDGTIAGIALQVVDGYWDIYPDHGVLIKGGSGIAGSNFTLDPQTSGAFVINNDSTNLSPSRFLVGNINIGGQKIQYLSGTTTLPDEANTFAYRPNFYNTFLTNDVFFSPTTNPYSTAITLASNAVSDQLVLTGADFIPGIDNTKNIGSAAKRWATIYAATGTINTSDVNQKTDIVDISDVEKRVAVKLKSAMKRFKFKDGKRYHFGTIAQDVKAAFESESLVAEEYGVFCSDVLEDGTVQLGIRYDELFAFIISAL
jgi:hypothetical protein